MRCFFVILIVLLQATLSVAKDSLCVWIMPNGASPKEKLETEMQKFTDKTYWLFEESNTLHEALDFYFYMRNKTR